jgi:hypothetical protein
MKITIDHDHCGHSSAFSDRCLAATIRNPLGHERTCMAQFEDDGRSELTIVLIFGGQEHELILHNDLQREIAASEGWTAFVAPAT